MKGDTRILDFSSYVRRRRGCMTAYLYPATIALPFPSIPFILLFDQYNLFFLVVTVTITATLAIPIHMTSTITTTVGIPRNNTSTSTDTISLSDIAERHQSQSLISNVQYRSCSPKRRSWDLRRKV